MIETTYCYFSESFTLIKITPCTLTHKAEQFWYWFLNVYMSYIANVLAMKKKLHSANIFIKLNSLSTYSLFFELHETGHEIGCFYHNVTIRRIEGDRGKEVGLRCWYLSLVIKVSKSYMMLTLTKLWRQQRCWCNHCFSCLGRDQWMGSIFECMQMNQTRSRYS